MWRPSAADMLTGRRAEYTLWNIPGSEIRRSPAWRMLSNLEITDADRERMTEFARTLDDARLDDILRPFNTPISPETWYGVLP